MRNILTEFIGTFFLVLTIGLTALSGTPFAPLAIGAALMVMAYMGGHISGAHYNPAVTLAVVLRGRLAAKNAVPYMSAQFAGALAAALATRAITGQTFAPTPAALASPLAALLVEVLFTFALALVVLNVGTSSKTEGNPFYGLAIGFTVLAGAFAGGPISGGAFNPAVGVGPTVVHALLGGGTFAHLWLYLVGPAVGGILAVLAFRIQEREG